MAELTADRAPPSAHAVSWREEVRATFTLAWPLIITQLAQTALFTSDVVLMGWLGPKYLAAGTLATSFFMMFLISGFGLVGAVAPLVAQARGAKDLRAVRPIVQQGLWWAVIYSAVLLPFLWQVRPVFIYFGYSEETALLAEGFVHYALWLFFPALMMMALRSFLSAFESTAVILVITLAGVVFNILGNYALMFGNWGFPRLELVGSGITTAVTNVLMFACMLGYVLTHRRYRRFHILKGLLRPHWARFREIFRVGAPIGLMLMAEVGLFTVAALLMGGLGTNEVAAHAIALQFGSLAFMVPLGLSQATTVRVGMAYGASSPEGVRRAGWTSLAATLAFMSATCVLFLTMRDTLVGLIIDPRLPENTATLRLAAAYLTVAGVFQIVDGAQVTAGAALRGLSDTRIPMLVALFGYWAVGMPVAYYFGFLLNMRGVGIWFGLASGLAFVAVVLVARFALRERIGLLDRRTSLQQNGTAAGAAVPL